MIDQETTIQPGTKLSLWRRLRRYALHPELSAECIALSFAIGFAMSWFPIIGTQIWIALAICFFFKKLHHPLLILTCCLDNPWTMLPLATARLFVGNLLLGNGWTISLSDISWHAIGIDSFTSRIGFEAMYSMLKPILIPYLFGGLILCLFAVPSGYWFMLWLSRKLRKERAMRIKIKDSLSCFP